MKKDIPWDDVRREYHAGERSLAAIGRAYGISRQAISLRSKKEEWGERQKQLAPSEVGFEQLMHKLEGALAVHIQSQHNFEELTPADRERAARTLSSLVRTLEKLNTIKPEDEATDEFPRDLAALREELAARLEKLRGEPAKPKRQSVSGVQRRRS